MKKFIITLLAAVFSMAGYAEVIDVGGLIPSTNKTIYLKVGEVKAISVSFNNPHANTYELEWSSNLSGFCTVKGDGRSAIITGVALSGRNNVQITCKDKVIGAQCVFVVNVGDPKTPTITQNPEDVTIIKGETATLSVEAEGGYEPYTYQWYEDGGTAGWIIISGATSSTYAAKPSATKAYNVTVTGADGTTKWASYCTVTVEEPAPLTITTQPQNVTIKKGETTTLSVEVTGGTPPYSYQWCTTKDGKRWPVISGATSSTYEATPTETEQYRCEITDANDDFVKSNGITVTVKSDVTAPTVSDKTITVKEVTSSRIWVTWNAAKDNITALASMKYKVFCVDEGAQGLAIMLVFATGGKVEELPVSYESTGARSATVTKYIDKDMKLQNLKPGKEYVIMIYALDKAGNYADYDPVTVKILATGIDNATADDEKTVSDVKYFAPDGRAVTATAKGLVIRKTTYTDGTVKTEKVRK